MRQLELTPAGFQPKSGRGALREDLLTMLDIAADVIRNPTFPDDELEKVRHEILTGIAEQEVNISAAADQSLRELIYPEPDIRCGRA